MYAGLAGAKRPVMAMRRYNFVFAIRMVRNSDEYTVEAREIDPRFGHQRCQFRKKIQGANSSDF